MADRRAAANTWLRLIPGALFCSGAYSLVLPLFRTRGAYGWGHYALADIVCGVPCVIMGTIIGILLVTRKESARKHVLKLLALVVSVVIAVAIGDASIALGLRQAWKASTTDTYWFDQGQISREYNKPDKELGFIRLPHVDWAGRGTDGNIGMYRTDRNGFRNSIDSATATLVFIGDSFTEAARVPEQQTFVRRAERLSGLTAVNLGRGFYGPQQEAIVLERYGLTYEPQFVIWQTFEGNDLSDARRYADWVNGRTSGESFKLRYTKDSPVARLLSRTIPREFLVPRSIRHSKGRIGGVFLDYHLDPDPPAREPLGFSEMKKAIAKGQELARSHSFELLIVLVPVKIRVLGLYVLFNDTQDRERWFPTDRASLPSALATALSDFCRSLGCDFIDSSVALKERAALDSRLLYASTEDTHLDTAGHEVIAESVVKWLRGRRVGGNQMGRKE